MEKLLLNLNRLFEEGCLKENELEEAIELFKVIRDAQNRIDVIYTEGTMYKKDLIEESWVK